MEPLRGKTLYRAIVVSVLVISLSVGVLGAWGVRLFRSDAASMAVQNAVEGLSSTVTLLVNVMSESGDRDFSGLKKSQLRSNVQSVLHDHSLIAGMLVSNEDGLELAALREGSTVVFGKPDGKTVKWDDSPVEGLPEIDLAVLEKMLQNERVALIPGQYSWTSAYSFHGHGESWMTVSWLMGEKGRMVTFILPVSVVVDQLARAEVGKREDIFIFWDSGRLVDVPEHVDAPISDVKLVTAAQVVNPVVSQAGKLLAEDPTKRQHAFRFKVNGAVWWAGCKPLSAFGKSMYIGVAIPQKAINNELTSDNMLYVFGVVLLVVVIGALLVLRRFRSRIEGMGMRQAYSRPDQILALIAEGESDRLEFKQTLRFNVKAGKNGREIEMASMKTVVAFLNSNGGTLLVGVKDDGEVLGLCDDNFENDDRALLHFNNLMGKHVGVHFQPFVNARIVHVDGKGVLRINCVRADSPAFLINGQDEDFYARSGPASRKLTVRQFYEYMRHSRRKLEDQA